MRGRGRSTASSIRWASSWLAVAAFGCVDLGGPAPDAAVLPDASHDGSSGDAGPPVEVRIWQMAYDPKRVVIGAGTTVRWTNFDAMLHTVTEGRPASSIPPVWSSKYLPPGGAWEHTFDDPGAWTYYCIPHSGTMRDAEVLVE